MDTGGKKLANLYISTINISLFNLSLALFLIRILKFRYYFYPTRSLLYFLLKFGRYFYVVSTHGAGIRTREGKQTEVINILGKQARRHEG
jgi:hypothetical protein